MARIIPPAKENLKPDYPKWFNPQLIAEAGRKSKEEINKLTKKADAPKRVIASYFCVDCNKVIQASNSAFIKQATQARKLNTAFKPECPNCGNEVTPYQIIEAGKLVSNIHSINQERKVDLKEDLSKEASSKGVYNTFIDQRIVMKVAESLGKWASKKGMTGCRARYLRGEHRKEAGSDTSILNNIECNLEWMYGRNQKGNATTKVAIDLAGNYEMPKVFKVASGMEYPFEEQYVRQLEREPILFDSMSSLKKSDTPTYRRPDPSRFRAHASKEGVMKVGEYKKDMEEDDEDEE